MLFEERHPRLLYNHGMKLAVLAGTIALGVCGAQSVPDYARAERFMPYNTAPLVLNGGVRATWVSGDRFWYRTQTAQGTEFVLIDAARGTRTAAFDHAKIAAAIAASASKLPFQTFDFSDDLKRISFAVGNKRWDCELQGYTCKPGQGGSRNSIVSPDKKRAAFMRDYNLWVRDVATGKETQLTTDGVKDFGYATDNAGWTHSDRADPGRGRPIRRRSRRSSRTSAAWARCTW